MPHKIELADPSALKRKRHPLHARAVPDPYLDSPQWIAFTEKVNADGRLAAPVRITPSGHVVDGWWGVLAACDWQLAQVEVVTVPEEDAALVIVESLMCRKHMLTGARVYLALGILSEYREAANRRRIANKVANRTTAEEEIGKDAAQLSTQLTAGREKEGSVRYLAKRFGCSHQTVQDAKSIRAHFTDLTVFTEWLKDAGIKHTHPAELQAELRAEAERKLFVEERGLGDILQAQAGRLAGVRGEPQQEQLDLFSGTVNRMLTSWAKLTEDGLEALDGIMPARYANCDPALLDRMEAWISKARKIAARATA